MKRVILILSLINCFFSYAIDNSKKVCVLGTGYVGLIVGACLADFKNQVICADVDVKKINKLVQGQIPIYEPGLKELVSKSLINGNLKFTTDLALAIQTSDIIYIAVGTPMDEDGNCNLCYLNSAINIIKDNINGYKIVINKSTVPIGTAKEMQKTFDTQAKFKIDVISNPEFLKEGTAVNDFLKPNRIVIGSKSEKAIEIIKEIYEPFVKAKVPMLITDNTTAEIIKYASNSFLATKVAIINELSALCEVTDGTINDVCKGMGLDDRIGPKFLNPGPGYGGSCFPKDILALLNTAQLKGLNLSILKTAHESNENHKINVSNKFIKLLGNNVKGKTISVLGLAFKANTDDVRCAPSITIIKNLINNGAHIKAYDPEAMNNMREILPQVEYCSNVYDVIDKTDGIILLTEWPEFKEIDWEKVKSRSSSKVIYDCRNILNISKLKSFGFEVKNIGNAEVN